MPYAERGATWPSRQERWQAIQERWNGRTKYGVIGRPIPTFYSKSDATNGYGNQARWHAAEGMYHFMPTLLKGLLNRLTLQTGYYAKGKVDLPTWWSGDGWGQGMPGAPPGYTAGIVEALELTQEAIIEIMFQMGYGWAHME